MLSMSSRMAASGIASVGAVEASPFVVRHRTLPGASVRTAVQGGASLFIGAEDWTHVKPLTVDDGEGLRCSWGLDAVCSSRRDVHIHREFGLQRHRTCHRVQQQLVEFGLVVTGRLSGRDGGAVSSRQ